MSFFNVTKVGIPFFVIAAVASSCDSSKPGNPANEARRPASEFKARSPLAPYEPKSERIPVALLDADSTLRVSPKGSMLMKFTPQDPNDVVLLPCVGERLKQLADDGYFIAIMSNQNIEDGETTPEVAEGGLATTARKIFEHGGVVHYFDFAGQKKIWKPAPDLVTVRLEPYLYDHFNRQIDWDRSFMVGDAGYMENDCVEKGVRKIDQCPPDGRTHKHFANSDRGFAENLFKSDMPFKPWRQHYYEPSIFFGWRQVADIDVFSTPAEVAAFNHEHPDACRVVTKDFKTLQTE